MRACVRACVCMYARMHARTHTGSSSGPRVTVPFALPFVCLWEVEEKKKRKAGVTITTGHGGRVE